MNFTIGARVVLNSGNVILTVSAIISDDNLDDFCGRLDDVTCEVGDIVCEWIDSDLKPHARAYNPAMLTLV